MKEEKSNTTYKQQLKELLLAIPILCLSVAGSVLFVKGTFEKNVFCSRYSAYCFSAMFALVAIWLIAKKNKFAGVFVILSIIMLVLEKIFL